MAFKEIKEIKINTQSFSDFFSSQTTDVDKGYKNYLLGQRQDCTLNTMFKYDLSKVGSGSGCAGIAPRIMDGLFGTLTSRNSTFNKKLLSQSEPLLATYLDYEPDIEKADSNIMAIFDNMYKADDDTCTPVGSETDYDAKKQKIIEILHTCCNNGSYILDTFYNTRIYVNNIYDVNKRSEDYNESHGSNWNNNTTYWPVYNFWCITDRTGGLNTESTIPGGFSNMITNSGVYIYKTSLCCGIPTYWTLEQLAMIYLYDTGIGENSRVRLGEYISNLRHGLTDAMNKISEHKASGRLIGTNVGSIVDKAPDWELKFDSNFGIFQNLAWSMGIDYTKAVSVNTGEVIDFDDIPDSGTEKYNLYVRDINDWFLVSAPKVELLSGSNKEHSSNTDIIGFIDNGISSLFGTVTVGPDNNFVIAPAIDTNTKSSDIINIFKSVYNYTNMYSDQKAYYDTEDKIQALLYECVKKGKCIYDTVLGYKIYITRPFYGSSQNVANWFTLYTEINIDDCTSVTNNKLLVTVKAGQKQGNGSDPRYTDWSVIEAPKIYTVRADNVTTGQYDTLEGRVSALETVLSMG